jgi:hypothetical protein
MPSSVGKKLLEIERKFWYNFNLEERVRSLIASSSKPQSPTLKSKPKPNDAVNQQQLILDSYYDDTDRFYLSLNDCWLRRRCYLLNSKRESGRDIKSIEKSTSSLQLKYASNLLDAFSARKSSNNFDSYFETENVNEMIETIERVRSKLGLSPINKSSEKQQDIIGLYRLNEFIRFETMRKSFFHNGIRIDLDEADFDYKLAELEIVLNENEANNDVGVDEAISKINKLASELGRILFFFFVVVV